jgi:hypothetical protein
VEIELRAYRWVRLPGTDIEVMLHGTQDTDLARQEDDGAWSLPPCHVRASPAIRALVRVEPGNSGPGW